MGPWILRSGQNDIPLAFIRTPYHRFDATVFASRCILYDTAVIKVSGQRLGDVEIWLRAEGTLQGEKTGKAVESVARTLPSGFGGKGQSCEPGYRLVRSGCLRSLTRRARSSVKLDSVVTHGKQDGLEPGVYSKLAQYVDNMLACRIRRDVQLVRNLLVAHTFGE